jgi:hypothetical protein
MNICEAKTTALGVQCTVQVSIDYSSLVSSWYSSSLFPLSWLAIHLRITFPAYKITSIDCFVCSWLNNVLYPWKVNTFVFNLDDTAQTVVLFKRDSLCVWVFIPNSRLHIKKRINACRSTETMTDYTEAAVSSSASCTYMQLVQYSDKWNETAENSESSMVI